MEKSFEQKFEQESKKEIAKEASESLDKDQLYHASGWEKLAEAEEGEEFILEPGPQGAEGKGVYFSENAPRFSAAEGAKDKTPVVVVIDRPATQKGWFRSKGYAERKFGRPRSWHTQGRALKCKVDRVEVIEGKKYLYCSWELL